MPLYKSGEIDSNIINDLVICDGEGTDSVKQMKRHLCKLFDAIMAVPKEYYCSEFVHDQEGNLPIGFDKQGLMNHVERVFAYELYHRWSCRLFGNKEGLIVNGEIAKNLKWFFGNGFDDNGKQKYPDLVLHKGPTRDEQMIVCEIKRKENIRQGITDDLIKLYRFTNVVKESVKYHCDPYKCGVFIVTNVEKSEVKSIKKKNSTIYKKDKDYDEEIRRLIVNNLTPSLPFLKFAIEEVQEVTKKILCVYSNWDEKGKYILSYQSLYNILSPLLNNVNVTTKTVYSD